MIENRRIDRKNRQNDIAMSICQIKVSDTVKMADNIFSHSLKGLNGSISYYFSK